MITNIHKYLKITILLSVFLFVFSCRTTKVKPRQVNSAAEYNLQIYALHPSFKVFHEKENTTKVYIKLLTKELLFIRDYETKKKKAKVRLHYEITKTFKNKTLIDSASSFINIGYAKSATNIVTFLELSDIKPDSFIVKIQLKDIYANKKSESYVSVNKSDNDNSQFYLCMNKGNFKPKFQHYFKKDETLLIRHQKTDLKRMFVKYYKTDFSIPLPPASTIKSVGSSIEPDSIWQLKTKTWQVEFTGKEKGVYRIQADTAKNYGITEMNFGEHFPLIKTSNQLIESLEYIATQYEFENMKNAENKKLAVDNFWLQIANNDTQKARQLIKIWYTRVTYANLFFTSYKEGWKTDKGMIFIVFGAPQIVKYTDGAEQWTYSFRGNIINFVFVNQYNTVSDNDFTLQRKIEYRSFWYKTIDNWRIGKV